MNYAELFRFKFMESNISYPPDKIRLEEIVERWEKEYPDDSNLFFAKAILASTDTNKEEVLRLIIKGENGKMYDSINYSWFNDTAISYYREK